MAVRLGWNAVIGSILAAAVLVSASVVFAQSGSSATTITGCVKKSSGALRVLSSAKKKCKANERRIAWNVRGPAGSNGAGGANGASGTNGANGANGAPGTPGANGANGANGDRGPIGPTGPTGASGADLQNISELDGVACAYSGQPGTIVTHVVKDPTTQVGIVHLQCLIPEACGNNQRDSAETCDDGNTANGDGCTSDCQLEPQQACGDGVTTGSEACDDGNNINTDSCSNTCQVASCGDAVTQSGAGEQCDDGNMVNGDGCTNTCEFENVCGDGEIDGVEACDDGGTLNGDGCSSACTVEATYQCTGQPSVCQQIPE